MTLFYITSAKLPANDAQSVQIDAMCRAFLGTYDGECLLISPWFKDNECLKSPYNWLRLKTYMQKRNLRYVLFTMRIFLLLLAKRPDFIFTRDILISLAGVLLGINVTYELHKEQKGRLQEYLIRSLSKTVKFKMVAISDALKDYYIENYYIEGNKIFVYHDGVFVERYDRLRMISKKVIRNELNLPIDKPIVMHTGSLYPGRGAELFEHIVRGFPDLCFVQVGGRPEDIKKWRDYYAGYGNIRFVSHQKNDLLIRYQMSADLLFLPMTNKNPIWWCTSPMKLFEYMATGNLILASDIGSVSEVLSDRNAILFDPDNPDTIISTMQKYLNNPLKMKTLAKQALEDLRRKYTWKIRANAILKFVNGNHN